MRVWEMRRSERAELRKIANDLDSVRLELAERVADLKEAQSDRMVAEERALGQAREIHTLKALVESLGAERDDLRERYDTLRLLCPRAPIVDMGDGPTLGVVPATDGA